VRGDTWEWNGERWSERATPASPSPRFDTSMAYDPARQVVVLFGGRDNNTSFGDTWQFNGRTWMKIDVPGPSPRNGHAMVYDPQTKALLLFGGRRGRESLNDLWKFDGAWSQIDR
jgi:hypothetical protein